jgi:hypothetical protein
MPAPDAYPAGIDPVHIWVIATTAAPSIKQDGTMLLAGGHHPARIVLPDRVAATEAETALRLVGYDVTRTSRGIRGRDLTVKGWSTEGLDRRLTAMGAIITKLTAVPDATAIVAVELGRLPAGVLPGPADRRMPAERAGQALRDWISATSGIHAPRDPRARPADHRCAFALAVTGLGEEAIDQLVKRHVQIAELAAGQYPKLRTRMDHAEARDTAIRRAIHTVRLSQRQAGTSTHSTDATTSPDAPAESAAPGPDTGPKPAPTAEFPADNPFSPATQPPSIRGLISPRGRNFPSGRAGRRPPR